VHQVGKKTIIRLGNVCQYLGTHELLPHSRNRNYCEIYEQIFRNGRLVVVILWFGELMSACHFQQISEVLHCADCQAQPQDSDYGLYEVQLGTNKLNLFYPSTDIPT